MEKMIRKEYLLYLNQKQIKIVCTALEEYCQLRLNNWDMLAQDIALDDHDIKILENKHEYDRFVQRREASITMLQNAMKEARPSGIFQKTEDMMIAEKLWMVIQGEPYLDQEDDTESSPGEAFPQISLDNGFYVLHVNRCQMKTMKTALEEYFRLRMNQWFDFANEVALDGYQYDKNDPDNSEKFNAYIMRRDAAKEAFERVSKIAQPRGIRLKTEKMLIVEDIWQVIRHRLFLDCEGPRDEWCVDAREPLQFSNEPLPEIRSVDSPGKR